jgi:hypothetical protein
MTIDEIIEEIKKQHYIPKFEIAIYDFDGNVNETLEFSVDEIDDFYWNIGYVAIKSECTYFELALIGQTENGGNEIIYNLDDIRITKWEN